MTEHHPDFVNEAEVVGRSGRNLARRLFPDLQDMIVVRRVIDASPDEVLSAMQDVFPGEPYRPTLAVERSDPFTDGVLILDG
jgi:hypothetical protein